MAEPWRVEVVVKGDPTAYVYPSGPFLKNYYVTRAAPGVYNFHLGNANLDVHKTTDVDQVQHLPEHTVKTYENSALINEKTLDHHPWNGERTVRLVPLVFKKSALDLINLDLVPILGDTGNKVSDVGYRKWVEPWGKSNITAYMPTTGERGDIGWVPDVVALMLMGGDPQGALDWYFAMCGCPLHWLDGTTGLPPNIKLIPGLNSYDMEDRQGAPAPGKTLYVIKGPKKNGYFTFADDWTPQLAHLLDAHYIVSVGTEDPVALLHLQHLATFALGVSAELFTASGARVQAGEYRGIAWGLGILYKTRAATKDAEARGYFNPAMHHPSSYWDALIADSHEYYLLEIKKPLASRFSLLNQSSTIGYWQHAYLLTSLAIGVLTKAPGAKELFIHCMKTVAKRYSGRTGWPPAWVPYYVDLYDDNKIMLANEGAAFDHLYHTEQNNVATAAAQIPPIVYVPSITTAQYNALKADPLNGMKIMSGADYMRTDHAAVVLTRYLAKKGLISTSDIPFFDEANANITIFFKNLGYVDPRYSLVDDVSKRFTNVTMPRLVDMGAPPPPVDPGAPIPPPPNYGTSEPGPDLPPMSYPWLKDGAVNAVSSKDTCFVDVTGKIPPGGLPKVMLNFKGNGRTILYVQWETNAGWINRSDDTPTLSDGSIVLVENHASGFQLRAKDVSEIIVNGSSRWKSAAPLPEPTPVPLPVPPPTQGTNMNFPQGVPFTLRVKPDAKCYGINFTGLPAGQLTLTPKAPVVNEANPFGIYDCVVNPVVDTTEEDFTVSAFVRTDETDATKGFTKSFQGRDVFRAASVEGTTFTLVP